MKNSNIEKITIPNQSIRELSKISSFSNTFELILIWASIIAAVWISYFLKNPIIYILAVLWIGARQHALGTITHDAAHWRLYKNRKLNDIVAEVFCAWPLFIRMQAYRYTHLKHHEFVGTDLDPEKKVDRYPTSQKEILGHVLRDITGLNTPKLIQESIHMDQAAPINVSTKIFRILYYSILLSLIAYFGVWKIVVFYWIVPIFTWLKVILRLRAIADHAGLEKSSIDPRYAARTLVPNLFDRLFIVPRFVSYHLCHHLYMTVPSRNLKALHEELLKIPNYKNECKITYGFNSLIKEFPWSDKKQYNFSKNGAQV